MKRWSYFSPEECDMKPKNHIIISNIRNTTRDEWIRKEHEGVMLGSVQSEKKKGWR